MKITKNMIFVLLALSSQLVVAIGVDVINMTSSVVEIDPMWSGNPRGYWRLNPNGDSKKYKTGVHQLRGLLVRYVNEPGAPVYLYNFEQLSLRGGGDVMVIVSHGHRTVSITGHRHPGEVGLVEATVGGKLRNSVRVFE